MNTYKESHRNYVTMAPKSCYVGSVKSYYYRLCVIYCVHEWAVLHVLEERGECWQEDQDTVHAQHRTGAVRPLFPSLFVRYQYANEQEEEVEDDVDREPYQGRSTAETKLKYVMWQALLRVHPVSLRSLGLAIAGNKATLTDVETVFGEQLDEADIGDHTVPIRVPCLQKVHTKHAS